MYRPDPRKGDSLPELVTIDVHQHGQSGLLIATSPELSGLYVHGRSDDELAQRIPYAIKALLEALGAHDIVVEPVEAAFDEGFRPLHTTKRFKALALVA